MKEQIQNLLIRNQNEVKKLEEFLARISKKPTSYEGKAKLIEETKELIADVREDVVELEAMLNRVLEEELIDEEEFNEN